VDEHHMIHVQEQSQFVIVGEVTNVSALHF